MIFFGWVLDFYCKTIDFSGTDVQTPSLEIRDPHCTIPDAVGCLFPDIQGAQEGGFGQCNGANTMNCVVSIACVGLSMREWFVEWAPMLLERQACCKTGHEPM